jgi:hypothetical protein
MGYKLLTIRVGILGEKEERVNSAVRMEISDAFLHPSLAPFADTDTATLQDTVYRKQGTDWGRLQGIALSNALGG